MTNHIKPLLRLSAALAILLPAAQAATIDAIYAFGDSLTDVGNVFIATAGFPGGSIPQPPYYNGEFSNGPVWIQDLALSLGLSPLTPSLTGGTDYAFASAQSGPTPSNPGSAIDLLPGQIAAFSAAHPVADPNALYAIWIGSDDLRNTNAAVAGATIAAAVNNTDQAIATLAAAGAKNFLVLGVPDLGLTPAAITLGPAAQAQLSALAQGFNGALFGSLGPLAAADGIHISTIDTYSLVDALVANPGVFGFTNVTQPCNTTAVNFSGGASCATPNQYLFWDAIHPTAHGQALVALAAETTLTPEPGTVSLFAAGLLGIGIAFRRQRP